MSQSRTLPQVGVLTVVLAFLVMLPIAGRIAVGQTSGERGRWGYVELGMWSTAVEVGPSVRVFFEDIFLWVIDIDEPLAPAMFSFGGPHTICRRGGATYVSDIRINANGEIADTNEPEPCAEADVVLDIDRPQTRHCFRATHTSFEPVVPCDAATPFGGHDSVGRQLARLDAPWGGEPATTLFDVGIALGLLSLLLLASRLWTSRETALTMTFFGGFVASISALLGAIGVGQ